MFKLHVYSQSGDLDQKVEIEGDTAVIGRSSECNVIIDRKDISRRHVRLLRGWVVDDLGSRNGTHLEGIQIAEATLVPALSFEIGDPASNNMVTIELISSDRPAEPKQAGSAPELEPAVTADKRTVGERTTLALPPDADGTRVAAMKAEFEAETARYRRTCAKLEVELANLRKQFDSFQRGSSGARPPEAHAGDTVQIKPGDVLPKRDGPGR